MSIRNCHTTLRSIPEERISYLKLGESLISFPFSCGGSTCYGWPRLATLLTPSGNSENGLVTLWEVISSCVLTQDI